MIEVGFWLLVNINHTPTIVNPMLIVYSGSQDSCSKNVAVNIEKIFTEVSGTTMLTFSYCMVLTKKNKPKPLTMQIEKV